MTIFSSKLLSNAIPMELFITLYKVMVLIRLESILKS